MVFRRESCRRAEAQLGSFGEKPPSVEIQALRNIAATSHACGVAVSGRQITVEDIQDIHHTLIGEDDPIARRLRERQNWMSSKSMAIPLEASYVGPPQERIPELMDDLANYMNADEGGSRSLVGR